MVLVVLFWSKYIPLEYHLHVNRDQELSLCLCVCVSLSRSSFSSIWQNLFDDCKILDLRVLSQTTIHFAEPNTGQEREFCSVLTQHRLHMKLMKLV